MRKRRNWHSGLSLLLAALLLLTIWPISGLAQNNGVIGSFDQPVTQVTVATGTDMADIPLPVTLAATMDDGSAENIPVTWDDGGLYDKDAAGDYLFTADIGAYTCAQPRPVAVVTVGASAIQPPANTGMIIASFDEPVIQVDAPLGWSTAELVEDGFLPAELSATLHDGTAASIPVTWEDGGLYDEETPGQYIFSAVLGGGYLYAGAPPMAVVTTLAPMPPMPFGLAPGEIMNGDGYGHSAPVQANPLADNIKLTGYDGWPTGVTSGQNGKFVSGVYDGNGGLWLIPYNANKVVRVDTGNGDMTEYDKWPPAFSGSGSNKFSGGVYDGNGGIWMIPFSSTSVVKVNTATGDMTSYSIGWPSGMSGINGKFSGGIYDGNGGIWMVPHHASAVVKIDIADGTMTPYSSWPTTIYSTYQGIFDGGVYDGNGGLWMIPAFAKEVVKINVDPSNGIVGEMTSYNIWPGGLSTGGNRKFSGGIYDGNGGIWMVPTLAGRVLKIDVDPNNGTVGHMTAYGNLGSDHFKGGTFDGRYLWMEPNKQNQIMRVDTTNGHLRYYNQWADIPGGVLGLGSGAFGGSVFDGENVWLVPYNADKVVKLSSAYDLTLSASPATLVFKPNTVTISALAKQNEANGKIMDMQWLRVDTTDTGDYSAVSAFDTKYTATLSADKGTVSAPNAVKTSHTYAITAKENGKYWVRVRYQDNIGTDKYLIKSITVNNIVTPLTYMVYKDSDNSFVSTHSALAQAVNACGVFATNGSYTIVATRDDAMLTATVNIPAAKRITVTSGSGGPYTITQMATSTSTSTSTSSDVRHFIVSGSLTLENITLSGRGYINASTNNGGVYVNNGSASLTLNTGAVITTCHHQSGSGIYNNGGAVTMNGGKISGNTALGNVGNGGGVNNGGTFTMTDGEISGNKSFGAGGGVYSTGSFTMNDGKINGNEAVNNGGGVCLVSGTSTFTMKDGEIIGNTAHVNGGGIYVASASTFKMTGGEISGNHADLSTTGNGGGIYTDDYRYTNPITPVASYYRNISIATNGNAVVKDNTAGEMFAPPSNANDFTTRAANPFPGTLLDNNNINYRNPHWAVRYVNPNAVNEEYAQSIGQASAGTATVLAPTTPMNFTPPAGLVFDKWTTNQNGTGQSYKAGDTIQVNSAVVTLYAQWRLPYVDLTVSKTVVGEFGSFTRDFSFTITVKDSTGAPLTGSLPCTGGTLSIPGANTAPTITTLNLNVGGEATFSLKHGQTLVIGDIPDDGKVQVQETGVPSDYAVSYTDSGGTGGSGTNTGELTMAGVNRTIAFTNDRDAVTATGINLGGGMGEALLIVTALLGIAVLLGGPFVRRRRKGVM